MFLVVVWTVPSSRDLEWGGPVVPPFGTGGRGGFLVVIRVDSGVLFPFH